MGKRENREYLYQFVAPDDQRDSIFGQWFNRDEASNQFAIDNDARRLANATLTQFAVKTIANCVVSVTGRSPLRTANCLVSVTNNVVLSTPVIDTTSQIIRRGSVQPPRTSLERAETENAARLGQRWLVLQSVSLHNWLFCWGG
ncbi:hypothetical protein CK516_23390 [Nostoc sp. 'Peltigera malacea cyanobiont' DB3992]|nr:hypothetical protein CK516_23390 [Nostoc sp. 'Peltigera malacea cyanobiont' DB3992]